MTEYEWTLPSDPASAARARDHVAQATSGLGCSDDAVLTASELVTNAIRHGRGTVRLSVTREGSRVRLSVRAASELDPVVRSPDPSDEGGRGLAIVDRIATRWGWDRSADIVHIWAEFGA